MYDFIGDKKPNYRIELYGSKDVDIDLKLKQYEETGSSTSSVVSLDNKYVMAHINPDGSLSLHLYNDLKFMRGEFNPDSKVEITELKNKNGANILPLKNYCIGQVELLELDDGEVLMFINEFKSGGSTIVYSIKSVNSIEYKQELLSFPTWEGNHTTNIGLGRPYKANNGNILLAVGNLYILEGKPFHQIKIMLSKDKGQTWTITNTIGSGMGLGLIQSITDMYGYKGEIMLGIVYSHGESKYTIMSVEGVEIEVKGPYNRQSINHMGAYENYKSSIIKVGGSLNKLYVYTLSETSSIGDVLKEENQAELGVLSDNILPSSLSIQIIDDKLLIKCITLTYTYLAVLNDRATNINNDVISINVDRPKNMIGGASILINNYMGKYAPDGKINPYLLWINKKIVIKLGYGNDLKTVFTGYIDNISMESFPQTLNIECRDTLKLANDQVYREAGKYIHLYKDIKLITLVHKVFKYCNIPIHKILDNDFRIKEYEVNYNTCYDILVELADILAYEVIVNNEGKAIFVPEQPEVGQTVKKTFKSGENITAINYRIDDNELYSSVIVQGTKQVTVKDKKGVVQTVDKVFSITKDYVGKDNYNLPPNKLLRIESMEAKDNKDLIEIADRALYLMKVRARQVTFEALADSTLQIGDFIEVFEESTTISEIYRITGISYTYDDMGYIMSIECYHHDRRV